MFLGVHTGGVSVQAHQKRTAAEDVLPGWYQTSGGDPKVVSVSVSVLLMFVSRVFSVLRHAALYQQRSDGHQSV